MRRFQRNASIFADKDALRESYTPPEIEERDEEIADYMDALQPVIDGWEPDNIFLYGNTGVGKTAVTDRLMEQLEADAEEYDDIDVTVFTVNCKTLSSSYQVAVQLVNAMRPDGGEIAATGHPKQTVFRMLYEELDDIGGTVLLILDEIDSIGSNDELLYELPRARANGNLENTKVGIIGISNDFKFSDQLDPRVQDTLCERELHFPAYEASELVSILESRAEIALKDDAVDQSAISLCAALAAKDRGSARQALDLLRLSGEQAERADDEIITDEHVQAARQELERERVEEGIRQLTHHGHLSLLSIVSLAAADGTPARTRTVFERYRNLCENMDISPLSRRSIHNHVKDLVMLGILRERDNNSGSGMRGNFNTYELDVPFDSALSALVEELEIDDRASELRRLADMNDVA